MITCFWEESGTPALHLDEQNWIIDGFNELIVDLLLQVGLFLDSTQPQPLKNPKQIHFYLDQTNKHQEKTRPASEQGQTAGSFKFKLMLWPGGQVASPSGQGTKQG